MDKVKVIYFVKERYATTKHICIMTLEEYFNLILEENVIIKKKYWL